MEEHPSQITGRTKRMDRCLSLVSGLPLFIVLMAILSLILHLIGCRWFIWTGTIALTLTLVCLGSYGLIAYDEYTSTKENNNK